MNKKQETVICLLAVACTLIYSVIGAIGLSLLLIPELAPFEPPSPYRVYLPLIVYERLIEHGIAATYVGLPEMCGRMQEMNTDWYYNWSYRTGLDCPNIEFIPMIWQSSMVGNEIPSDAKWLSGFNECGIGGQCPDTPCEAAIGWRNLEQTYAGVKLISPAILGWYGADWHLGWLVEMYDCYVAMYGETPRFDAVAAHCYGSDAFCQEFLTDVIAYVDTIGGQGIWVTEFANAPTDGVDEAQMLVSMEVMVNWFEANPRIDRWAWFALTYRGDEAWIPGSWVVPYTTLVDFDSGELTDCGELYRELGEE